MRKDCVNSKKSCYVKPDCKISEVEVSYVKPRPSNKLKKPYKNVSVKTQKRENQIFYSM